MKITMSVKELNAIKTGMIKLVHIINTVMPEAYSSSEIDMEDYIAESFNTQIETSFMKVDYTSDNPMCEISEEFYCDAMTVYKRIAEISVSPITRLSIKAYSVLKGLPILGVIYRKTSEWLMKTDELRDVKECYETMMSDIVIFAAKYELK